MQLFFMNGNCLYRRWCKVNLIIWQYFHTVIVRHNNSFITLSWCNEVLTQNTVPLFLEFENVFLFPTNVIHQVVIKSCSHGSL